MAPLVCNNLNISPDRQKLNLLSCSVLNDDQLRSLQSPVSVIAQNATEVAKFCPGTSDAGLTTANRITRIRALQTAVQVYNRTNPTAPLFTNEVNRSTSWGTTRLTSLRNTFNTHLAASGLPADTSTSPQALLTSLSTCFLPPVVQRKPRRLSGEIFNRDIHFYDRRENRDIDLLQIDLTSLIIWNRDGIFVQGTNTNTGQGFSADNLLYVKAPADSSKPAGSLARLGLAHSDDTEGGMVWHFNIDKSTYTYTNRQSPYGFGITEGRELMGPLTVATEQPIYVQGDYNTGTRNFTSSSNSNPTVNANKYPASILADVITVLSNACINRGTTSSNQHLGKINCGVTQNFNADGRTDASHTTINAAFLARTDNTIPSQSYFGGGLNNYMRMLEHWEDRALNYRGSFVSLGEPLEHSGRFILGRKKSNLDYLSNQAYFHPPIRNWAFDLDYNTYKLLPPLSPRVIYLQQDVFKRNDRITQ